MIIPGPDNVRTFQGFGPITPTEPTSSGQVVLEVHATQDMENTLTQPPTSVEAVMMEYITPDSVYKSPQAKEIPLPHGEDMDLITNLILPESAQPPSRASHTASPISHSVSQIPELPTAIKDVHVTLLGQPGRENVHTNVLLSCIVKAGGHTQRALQENSTVENTLEILYRTLDDGKEGIRAIADTVIASGDKEMYKKTTAVRHAYRCTINEVLSDLDDMTVRKSVANLPTKAIPTDMFAILKSLKEMCDENEMNAEMLRAEIAELKMSFAVLHADVHNASVPPSRPAAPPTIEPKVTSSPKSTPGPGPKSTTGTKNTVGPKSTTLETTVPPCAPAPPPFKGPSTMAPAQTPDAAPAPAPKTKPKTVTIQVSGLGPSSVPNSTTNLEAHPAISSWSDLMDLDKDTNTPGGPVEGELYLGGDTSPMEPLSDALGDVQEQEGENDGFQTVNKGKGKAHGGPLPTRSFAQAAKIAADSIPDPKVPVPTAAKIASDIRAMGRNDTPVRFAGHSNSILEDYTHMTSPTMYRLVNDVFVRWSTHPRIIHVGWNPKGNLVLNFPANAPVLDIKAALLDITKALGLPEDMTYTQCTHWSKVALGRVPTGFINGEGAHHSEAELMDELTCCNPHIAMLTITYGPRWIMRDLAWDKDQSTITFAFEDNMNGSTLAALLKKPTFMGGQRLIVSKWNNCPILKGLGLGMRRMSL
ncbi:hypothetical protein FRC10_011939 [Ceratobasidium sp. 414]|nr:hypothetical protein FRC10_011939 [Ceratobasidium sp. 414]